MQQSAKTRYYLVVLTLVGLVGGTVWGMTRSLWSRQEAAARSELTRLGGIVVLDSWRKHVATLNLTTVPPEKFSEAMRAVSGLRWLTALDASRADLGPDAMQQIGQLTSLESLTLIDVGLNDEEIRTLTPLRELQALYLPGTAIGTESLSTLAQLPSLRILDLSGTQITGGLGALAPLRQLDWLLLRKLQLNDGSLADLAGCSSLKRLTLEDCQYPEESLQALTKRRPDLAIDR